MLMIDRFRCALMQLLYDCLQALKLIFTNRSIALTMVLSVGFYGFFYPAAYQAEHVEHLPLVIVDAEQSPLTHTIIQTTANSPNIHIHDITTSFREAMHQVKMGRADGILYLPDNLSQSIHHQDTGGIGLYLSGAYLLKTQTIGKGLVSSLKQTLISEIEKYREISHFHLPPPVHEQPLFNTTAGYGSYVFPAVAPLIVHQTLLPGVGMLLMEYRRRWLRLTTSRFLAIYVVSGIIGCLSCWFLFGFVYWHNDYPRGGNFWGMMFATPIFVGAVISLSLVISSYFDRAERVGQMLIFSSIPLFLLSRLAYPMLAMPDWLTKIAWLLPGTHGIQSFIQLNQMGAPTHLILAKLYYLMAVMLLLGTLAYWRLVLKPIKA